MSFHDPPDLQGTLLRDGPAPARSSPPAGDATHSGDSDRADATATAPDPIREIAVVLAVHGTGTIERMLAEQSDLLTSNFLPASPSPAAAAPTVPNYELLEQIGEGGWESSGRPGKPS